MNPRLNSGWLPPLLFSAVIFFVMLMMPTTSCQHEGVILLLALISLVFCSIRVLGIGNRKYKLEDKDTNDETEKIRVDHRTNSLSEPMPKQQVHNSLYFLVAVAIGTSIYIWLISRSFFFGIEVAFFLLFTFHYW